MVRRFSCRTRSPSGFTLVELLIAAVVMLLSTIGGATMFNHSTRQGVEINRRLRQQFAISNDLAAIHEMNERYKCNVIADGCQAVRESPVGGQLPSPPNQNQYVPDDGPEDPSGGKDQPVTGIDRILTPVDKSFRQLCAQGLLYRLLPELSALNPDHDLVDVGVTRTVSLDPASSAPGAATDSIPPHRYRVDWKDRDGTLLRQVQLVPTVAAWCP
ncbi:MAG: PilW family protein [Cyanobium sp.]